MVWHREIEVEQLQDGADQPLGLAQRQAEHRPQGQRRRDRQIRVGGLPAPGGARRGHPGRDRLRREPDRQAAAGAQTGVVLGPVGHPVPLLRNVAATGCLGFEWHGRGPSVRKGAVVLHRPAPDANRPIRATSVDAPFRARENIRNTVTRSRMLPSVRPLARSSTAGLHGSSRSGSRSRWRTRSTVLQPGCPDPVSPTVAPCPPSARPTPRWPRRAYAVAAGTLYVPPLTSRAQTMRAILLARAVVTSMRGLRASIRASHEPAAAPR